MSWLFLELLAGLAGLWLAVATWARWARPGWRAGGPRPTMIVLGSGGHTAEMLKLISNLDMHKYQPRVYVTAATDAMSERKAHAFESGLAGGDSDGHPGYRTAVIPRSREVGQSWTSSAFSTAYAMLYAAALVFRERPDLVLVNGPGTCIPICVSAFVSRLLGLAGGQIVYVESIARVYRLSLSGKILYHLRLTSLFFVQWEELHARYPRTLCPGRLM